MSENTWYLRTQDETFGPETRERMIEWARMGRILPGQEVSDDNLIWRRVEEVPFLDMRFSIDIGDGNPRGPFNRAAADALLASGRLPPTAKLVEVRAPFEEEKVEPEPASVAAEPEPVAEAEPEPVAEAEPEPVAEAEPEPVADAASEPPVDAAARRVQLEDDSSVSDAASRRVPEAAPAADARIAELEALLEEARRQATELQVRLDAAVKDVELQREEFQQKAEAAAQEAAAQLEAARQKAEIAAQDADARLMSVQQESSARLAAAEQAATTTRTESAAQIESLEKQLESARRDAAEQLESLRQKAESDARSAETRLAEEQKSAAARLEQVQQEAAARFEQAQQEAAARFEQAQRDAETRLTEVRQKAETETKDAAARLAEALAKAESVQKDADAREVKSREQIVALENELRRLPQAASEIADVQAAVYTLMTKEAAELAELIETEKRENDEFRRRQQERADRLLERRRELLKRTGANIEDMTRKALVERPEDPRTAQLRREYEEFRRADEKKSRAYEDKLLAKSREIEELRREISRRNVVDKDASQLQAEVVALSEKLQRCEKDLLTERQLNEELHQRQATNQQVLMARLATLESPTIAPAGSFAPGVPETRQSREAKSVKLPRWMQLGGKR